MSDLTGPKAAESCCRRLLIRFMVIVGVLFALLVLAVLLIMEDHAYHDLSTCYSDNMGQLKDELEAYVQEHDGQMPATFDELRARMVAKCGHPNDVCQRAVEPYIWMPPDVKMNDGRPVVLMCPPKSHGWLRKYAYGLVRDGDTVRFVRVRGKRATPFRWRSACP